METVARVRIARNSIVLRLFLFVIILMSAYASPRSMAAGTADTTPPSVSMTAPTAGATVSKPDILISAAASDNIGVVGVQFRVDGMDFGSEDTTAPYGMGWYIVGLPDGPHVLTAVARDAAGNQTTSAPIAVTKDTTPPAVSMTAPAAGATVSKPDILVSAAASDNIGVVGVQFRVDGMDFGSEDTTAPYGMGWYIAGLPDGSYVLTAVARDAAGNQTISAPIAVTKDTTVPAVSMTAPATGAKVSGSAVMISAAASDSVGVVGVQFQLDGMNVGAEDTAAPYSIMWDTTSATNGSHMLTAVARDAAGNQTTSALITVIKITPDPSMTSPSSGAMGSTSIKYVRVKPDAAVAPPVGVLTLAYRDASTLVSETTLASSVPVQSGRIYVDLTSSVKTGIAFANPNAQDAIVAFYFANAGGTPIRGGVYRLLAEQQVAAFLDAVPFSGPVPMEGTFTFVSTVPISAVAVRGFTNERGDFLMAQVPVSPLAQDGERVLLFPSFEDRGIGRNSVVLVNPTGNTLSGSLQFYGQPSALGTTLPVNVGGGLSSTIPYVLPPQGEVTIWLQGVTDVINVGSARIIPSSGSAVPQAFSLFSYKSNIGVTTSDTILPSVSSGQAFRMPVASSKALTEVDWVRTTLALFNPSASAVTVLLELRDLSGTLVGTVAAINLPAGGQLSQSINELLPQMPVEFGGILRVTASSPVVVAGLRGIRNGRGEFLVTAMPAWNESILLTGSESNFAYVLDGGGYTPKFVILSPAPASADAGMIWLVNRDGSTTETLEIN